MTVQIKRQSYSISQNFHTSPEIETCNYFDSEIFVSKQNSLKKSDSLEDSHPINIPSQDLHENQHNQDFFIGSCASDSLEKS
ncbi:MAG: hypothetical protein ACFB02_07745 [Mastigocoleus sp.]